jgi:hypothetical protein
MFGSFRDLAFLGVAAGTGVALDPDAQSYITAVETVDGQALEAGVRDAINAFVVGCKADGIWTAIKACCIMAGARTRLGAMVPLVGAAPTSFNFVDGDYNRKTGLVGDGSTKYLDSNRNNNADPQNSQHLSVYISTASTISAANRAYIGAGLGDAGSSQMFAQSTIGIYVRSREFGSGTPLPVSTIGFLGKSRLSASGYTVRGSNQNYSFTAASQTPFNQNIVVFGRNLSAGSNARLAFYSIGESLGLALLDARVTDLINAFGAAIP